MKPEYRFKYQIVDETTDEVIVSGDTFISETITQYGENESVDMEVGSAMRFFKNFLNKKKLENEIPLEVAMDNGLQAEDLIPH